MPQQNNPNKPGAQQDQTGSELGREPEEAEEDLDEGL